MCSFQLCALLGLVVVLCSGTDDLNTDTQVIQDLVKRMDVLEVNRQVL